MPFIANVQEPTTAGGSGSSPTSLSRPLAPANATDAGRAFDAPIPGWEGGNIDTGRAAGEARLSQFMLCRTRLTAGLGCDGGGGVARDGGAGASEDDALDEERRRPDAARARAAGLMPTGGGGASSSSPSSAAAEMEEATLEGGGAVRDGGGAKRAETLRPPDA